MSPTAYYCWLSERRWVFGRRFQPTPDRNYPWWIALVMPLVVTGLVLGVGTGIFLMLVQLWPEGFSARPVSYFLWKYSTAFFLATVIHWGFTWFSWNRRAARLRASGSPAVPSLPPGRITRWMVGPFYLFCLAIVVPLWIHSAVEHLRARSRWFEVRDRLLAQGERLDIREVIPKPVPDDQNFFSTAPFNRLLVPARDGVPARVDAKARFEFEALQLPEVTPERGAGDPGRVISLAQWATAFRAAASDPHGAHVRRPPLPDGADDATVVLIATSIAEPYLSLFCNASRRPGAVFPIEWERGSGALLPHLAPLRNLNRLLDVRIAAKLANGDKEGAFADVECSLRLATLLTQEPLVISRLVQVSQYAAAERSIWRGIVAHAWNDEQLAEFQRQLALPNFVQSMAYSLEGERSLTLSMLERWTTNRTIYREQLDLLTSDSNGSESQRSEPWRLLSAAVLRQNLATLAEGYQALLDSARHMATNPPAGGQADVLLGLEADLAERNASLTRQGGPENAFAKLFLPSVDQATEKAVRAQVDARCAIAACALERYRLRKGGYPESFADLVPEFLPEMVRDPMDGKPMRYARMPGGRFRLWSVGKNGLDDGGRLRPAGAMRKPGPTLDWPWPYPMAEGEASQEP